MHASAACSNCLRANELYHSYGLNFIYAHTLKTHIKNTFPPNDGVDFFFVFNSPCYTQQSNKTMAAENKWARLHHKCSTSTQHFPCEFKMIENRFEIK